MFTVIIPYYRKLTGDVSNLPYSEKPFISRIVLSLMERLELSVSGVEGYHLFTNLMSYTPTKQRIWLPVLCC
jgi:hypothetical protein